MWSRRGCRAPYASAAVATLRRASREGSGAAAGPQAGGRTSFIRSALSTWWIVLGTVLQHRQPRGHDQVEPRLLGVGLAQLLAQQVAQRALEPRDRSAEAPGRADQRRVGLDHRPLHELLHRDPVGRLDDEPGEVLAEARPLCSLQGLLGLHATTSVPISR